MMSGTSLGASAGWGSRPGEKRELREGSLDLAFTPVLDTKMRGHGRGLTSERARISGAGSRVASEFV